MTGADLIKLYADGERVFDRADLQKADLQGAKVHNIRWPSPAMVLLAEWGQLSDDLTLDLMRLDAWGHPDPKAFDHWVEGGPCPYDGVDVQRVASFKERKGCWSPGPPKKLYTLMRRVLEECCDYGEGE